MKIALACDHGGFLLKQSIRAHLDETGVAYEDLGTHTAEETRDYPYASLYACNAINEGRCNLGILVCGTGIGVSMAANKMKGIRAACCSDTYSARFTRLHNDANVLCLGGRVVGPGLADELVDAFLGTSFEGGRHARRVGEIMDIQDGKLTK